MVTVQQVTCKDIPVGYVDELPTKESGSVVRNFNGKMVNRVPKYGGLASKRVKRARPTRAKPLRPIDLETIDPTDLKNEAGKVYEEMKSGGPRGNPWFEKSGGVSGRWIEFLKYPHDKHAVGIRDLSGCTVITIITSKGVYMAHIWETFFADEQSVPVDVDEFDRTVIEPLISGGHPGVGALLGLIGTDQGPGHLHHSKEPTIVVITPHDYDDHGKVFRYQSHAKRLADRLGRVIYPNRYPDLIVDEYRDKKKPLIAGYDPNARLSEVEKVQIPRWHRKMFRKIALEVTRRNELIGEKKWPGAAPNTERTKLFFRGTWRLWVGPTISLEQDFWDEESWYDKWIEKREKRGELKAEEEEEDIDPCLYWDAPPASSSGSFAPASTSRALINTSTTPFGTSTTPTPTPTGLCSYEACSNDSECTLEDGATGFVSTGPVDCSDVPIEDVDHLPDEIEGSEVVMLGGDPVNSNHLTKRGNTRIEEKPLRDLDHLTEEEKPEAYRLEVVRAINRLTTHNGWVATSLRITAKWVPLPQFPHDKMTTGLRSLRGCTAVMIITGDGVYVAHIWQVHYFTKVGTADAISIPDFLERTVAPIAGNSEEPEPSVQDTIRSLIGTDDDPGVLHHTREPHVFVITPWADGQVGQAYEYPEHARYLANALGELIYPDGYPKEELRPIIKAYDRSLRSTGHRGTPHGKVILEMTRRNAAKRLRIDRRVRVHFTGLWRLWVGAERVADVHFWKRDNWILTRYDTDGLGEQPIIKRGDAEAEENSVDACPYWTLPPESAISSSSLLPTEMMSPTTGPKENPPRTLLTTTKDSKTTTK